MKEVLLIVSFCTDLREREIHSITYSSELRGSEAIKLREQDICQDRMRIFIRQSKEKGSLYYTLGILPENTGDIPLFR